MASPSGSSASAAFCWSRITRSPALLYLKDADFAAVLAKADALRAAYDVTVLPQAKKLGKQFGTLEAAGYNAVAFADNDDIKVLGQKAE